ncbi:MAG: DNA gyrase subunit A [Lentisphaeria bacterium]|nr:DNA gyrase subunit A [Lentisphaeria bacterium]MDY0176929.1 DNA gyrase subunit A [Lentisphaeria bacterium]NLZ59576.1 DNA gyrase subunit A [Lentisphaerota bacterium]
MSDENSNLPADSEFDSQSIAKNDIPYAIEDIMHTAYLQYSVSANVGRAIPDVRDGLKPGNRRILYAMRQRGFVKNSPYTKCAKVVGEVIGNYHPHGDGAVYDTMVRMAQDFSMRCPLIDGQGNFGSIDGDSPAAYRYTECRMERLAEELLADLEKETVDMRPTFDEKDVEPSVLPARFPNLLVNGAQGIGVGMATNIPPHNLGEVIDGTIAVIDNPRISIRELMRHIPGPDYPTGGTIQGLRSIISLYETGRGSVRLRGKAEIEENKGREKIIISEIPYAVNKENMVMKIAELVSEGRISGISALEDLSSSRVGIRIEVEIKRGHVANVVLNQLYSMTQLESVSGAQFLVVDRNRPRTMNLKQILEAYIDHREEVVTRRCLFELRKAEERAHIVAGLLIAQANINEVVQTIREAANREEAAARLMQRFELSERQTKAILEMRLYQLTSLAVDELQAEYDKLKDEIARLKAILASRLEIMHIVKEELLEVKRKYADARRSMIVPGENDIDLEDLIARDICVIPLSATGYIKRVPASEYEAQHRGGKGVRGMRTKDEDYVSLLLTCCTHDIIMFFTNKGQMRWLKGYEIPEGTRDSQGKALVNLLELQEGEKVRAMIPVADMEQGGYVVMATKNGTVKKTELAAFKHLRKPGIIAIKLEEDDDLIDAQLTSGEDEILLLAANGMACRFDEKDIRSMGRNSIGVRGMELRDSEGKLASELVAMSIVDPEDELLLVTAQGMGKRVPIGQGSNIVEDESEENVGETLEVDSNRRFRRTRRGAKGVISIRLRAGDSVVAALQVPANSKQELLLISVNGQTVRLRVQDVRLVGRAGVGVIVMRLYENDLVATATIVDELSEEEIAANQAKAEEDANLAVIEAHFQDRENPAPANDEDEEPDENEETDQPE